MGAVVFIAYSVERIADSKTVAFLYAKRYPLYAKN